jgi:hypothetical protein
VPGVRDHGWAVDLTVTADGQLVATLTAPASSDRLTMRGHIESGCSVTIPVIGGGTFSFPCWSRGAC